MSLLESILSVKNVENHKVFTIFGIKIKLKRRINAFKNDIINEISELHRQTKFEIEKATLLLRTDAAARQLHPETFAKYKNAFAGKDVVLLATGPSLNQFKPIEDAIYVGVKKAFLYEKVKLDYLFFIDYPSLLSYIEEAKDCPAVKFYGLVRDGHLNAEQQSMVIPESVALRHNAFRFYENGIADPKIQEDLNFAYDLTCTPLTTYSSVVFFAMQFIMWGNPRRIYLVGCDVSQEGHWDSDEYKMDNWFIDTVMRGWKKMKEFCETFYPETEIISVNPVNLRGMFKDWDQ